MFFLASYITPNRTYDDDHNEKRLQEERASSKVAARNMTEMVRTVTGKQEAGKGSERKTAQLEAKSNAETEVRAKDKLDAEAKSETNRLAEKAKDMRTAQAQKEVEQKTKTTQGAKAIKEAVEKKAMNEVDDLAKRKAAAKGGDKAALRGAAKGVAVLSTSIVDLYMTTASSQSQGVSTSGCSALVHLVSGLRPASHILRLWADLNAWHLRGGG
jgi:membrane protein involved in colicin uptake